MAQDSQPWIAVLQGVDLATTIIAAALILRRRWGVLHQHLAQASPSRSCRTIRYAFWNAQVRYPGSCAHIQLPVSSDAGNSSSSPGLSCLTMVSCSNTTYMSRASRLASR
eukprot:4044994-Heterocapsa_arctica.AAC.1